MMAILDKKTGKAEPWAALQLAAYTLLDAPAAFEVEGHRYRNGLESVTQILKAVSGFQFQVSIDTQNGLFYAFCEILS